MSEKKADPRVFDDSGVMEGLKGIFEAYEVQVISVVGLLVGYISIFLIKIADVGSVKFGAAFIALTTVALLCINSNAKFLHPIWWLRTVILMGICLAFLAPQIHSAWTVTSNEHAAVRAQERQARGNEEINNGLEIRAKQEAEIKELKNQLQILKQKRLDPNQIESIPNANISVGGSVQ